MRRFLIVALLAVLLILLPGGNSALSSVQRANTETAKHSASVVSTATAETLSLDKGSLHLLLVEDDFYAAFSL